MVCHTQETAFLSLGLWGWQVAADLNTLWPEEMGPQICLKEPGRGNTKGCPSDYRGFFQMIVLFLYSIIVIALIELHGNGVLRAGRALTDHLHSWFIDEKTESQRGTGFAKFTQQGCDIIQGSTLGQLPVIGISMS